jgi:hypothetical protein
MLAQSRKGWVEDTTLVNSEGAFGGGIVSDAPSERIVVGEGSVSQVLPDLANVEWPVGPKK